MITEGSGQMRDLKEQKFFWNIRQIVVKFCFQYWASLSELINFYSPWNDLKQQVFW